MRLFDLFYQRKARNDARSRVGRRAVIALGGGGARGIAHLGVMQSMGEWGIQTERIVGVSMGSLVGAMCAVEPDIHRVQANTIEFLRSPVFQLKQGLLSGATPPADEEDFGGVFSWYERLKKYVVAHRKLSRVVNSSSLISDEPLRESIDHLLPDIDISEARTPLSIVTLDLLSGQRVILENGPLRRAIRASMAIPGIFPPVRWENMLLTDIGVIESIPTPIARAYATDLTIAVDVGQDIVRIHECGTAMDVLMRVDDICERMMRRHVVNAADIVIRPEVGFTAWFDFSEPERLIDAGRLAGRRALDTIDESAAA